MKSRPIALALCAALAVQANAFAFGIDELRALVLTDDLDTVAAVIAKLPEEYKRNYTLAHHSGSLQGSSYLNPRAILFGRTAQFILTFNGDPAERNYQSIEALQFRERSESFEFYAIDFTGDTVRFAPPNPVVCTGCHGSPPHPIWSSYEYGAGDRQTSHWPGFYGSTHDAPVLTPGEKTAFQRFRKGAAANPRYRHLVLSQPGAPWFPYGTGPHEHRLRPNDRLGNLLARWQARQIVALIRQAEFVARHPRMSQAWLLQCPGIRDRRYRARVEHLFQQRFPSKDYEYLHTRVAAAPTQRRTGFMMEHLLTGQPRFGWNLSIDRPGARGHFYTGIVSIDSLVAARWMATLGEHQPLKAYYQPWDSRALYNTFAKDYYETNVEPGGVGRNYDRVMSYYNESRARRACPGLMRDVFAGS